MWSLSLKCAFVAALLLGLLTLPVSADSLQSEPPQGIRIEFVGGSHLRIETSLVT